jgi:hypothetical protein
MPDVKLPGGCVDHAGKPLACQSSAHVVVLMIEREVATGPDGPSKGSLIHLHEPAIRINHFWDAGQHRELLTGHTGRLVPCLVSASKSPRTWRCNQIEVPASTRVGNLHHLLLAIRISRHTTGIFQIELDAPPPFCRSSNSRESLLVLGRAASSPVAPHGSPECVARRLVGRQSRPVGYGEHTSGSAEP